MPAIKRKATHPEADIQIAFMRHLELQYPRLFKVTWHTANERKCSWAYGKHLISMGVKQGVPDVFIAFPRHGKSGLFIEFKHGVNKLTSNQSTMIKHLTAEGYQCEVCYSEAEAWTKLQEYLKGVKSNDTRDLSQAVS